MQRLVAVVSLVVLAGSCGGPHSDLVGTWVFDYEAFQASAMYKEIPESERPLMNAIASKMKMEITFTEDKVRVMTEGPMGKIGEEYDYEVKSTDGDQLVLEGKDEQGRLRRMTVTVDGDTLTFDAGKNKAVLKRK